MFLWVARATGRQWAKHADDLRAAADERWEGTDI